MPRASITAIVASMLALACSSKSEPRPQPSPSTPTEGAPSAADSVAAPGAAVRADHEPVVPPSRPASRGSRPIDIVLRSSPPRATAAVDGVPIGPTPTYWSGEANGREHEFTFVLPGYAFARYRFVPITSGVVHARLEALTDDTDAGVPVEMMRAPPDVPEVPAGTPVGPDRAEVPDAAASPDPQP